MMDFLKFKVYFFKKKQNPKTFSSITLCIAHKCNNMPASGQSGPEYTVNKSLPRKVFLGCFPAEIKKKNSGQCQKGLEL